jgi:thioredoxin-related protein
MLSNFVCVIVDGDEEKSAASKLGANGYPHLVFLSSKGDKLEEQSGYAPVAVFKPLVQKALEKSRQGS